MSSEEMYCPVCGKRMLEWDWKYRNQADQRAIKCPKCNSYRILRDAKRYTPSGEIQRYLAENVYMDFQKGDNLYSPCFCDAAHTYVTPVVQSLSRHAYR